ncbi:photosystem II core complex proteins psbY, chloroplastic-like [Canna indica]|uniref:Photosystem II core complex proteins psbY, chloroplastic-like n=1 Tax=Canna indica TaxID=4628 RepID=A0AAQ3K5H5_9LILI|nr:photosystem II core complex proteins psbY, chloroplastic-like [Canna indica]
MAAMATMAILNAKYPAPNHLTCTSKPTPLRPAASLLSLHNLPKGLAAASRPVTAAAVAPPSLSAASIAGAFFANLASSDAALAAQQIADIAADDNRGIALLIPLIPAILWVLYNILQPALNQLNRMRSEKAVAVGLGIGGGVAAAGFLAAPSASAYELAAIADAASSSDSRGLLLLFVVAPAILWVLYNILQPALNQLDRMRSG